MFDKEGVKKRPAQNWPRNLMRVSGSHNMRPHVSRDAWSISGRRRSEGQPRLGCQFQHCMTRYNVMRAWQAGSLVCVTLDRPQENVLYGAKLSTDWKATGPPLRLRDMGPHHDCGNYWAVVSARAGKNRLSLSFCR